MSSPYYKRHWIDIEPERHAAYDRSLGYHPALEPIIRPLDLRPGLHVLDVGSGPAHTTLELARRVAPSGPSPVSTSTLSSSRDQPRERARPSFPANSLTVDFRRCRFPAASSTACSAKMFLSMSIPPRILSPKWRAPAPGRLIVVASDSDWDLMVLETGAAIASATSGCSPLPKASPSISRASGGCSTVSFARLEFVDVKVGDHGGRRHRGGSLPMLKASFARYAHDSGRIADEEIATWLASVEGAIDKGNFFFVLPQFVARGVKK